MEMWGISYHLLSDCDTNSVLGKQSITCIGTYKKTHIGLTISSIRIFLIISLMDNKCYT